MRVCSIACAVCGIAILFSALHESGEVLDCVIIDNNKGARMMSGKANVAKNLDYKAISTLEYTRQFH